MARQAFTKKRSDTHSDGERGEQRRHHGLVAVQYRQRVGRYLQGHRRAEEPEPGNPEDRKEDTAVLARERHDMPGLGPAVSIDAQCRIDGTGRGDAPARKVSGHCKRKEVDRDRRLGVRGRRHRKAADNQAEDDGDIGSGFDESVAADQFGRLQLLWQVGILDRAEQCRLRAHQEQHEQQQDVTLHHESGGCDQHEDDFEQFDPPHEHRLFVLLG